MFLFVMFASEGITTHKIIKRKLHIITKPKGLLPTNSSHSSNMQITLQCSHTDIGLNKYRRTETDNKVFVYVPGRGFSFSHRREMEIYIFNDNIFGKC